MEFEYENSYEVKEKIKRKKVAVLPIGAVEAHGPHLPLGTDNLLARRLSEKLAELIDAFILPTLPYGQVWSLKNFPGSINVSNNSLISLIYDIGESLYRQGFKIFVMVNGHLGNAVAMKEAARKLYDSFPELKVVYLFYPGTGKIVEEIRESPASHGTYFHACEIETSYMLYLAPEFVHMEKAIDGKSNIQLSADVTPTPWEEITDSAVLGDATLATSEKGEKVIQVALENMVKLIEEMKDGL
ncbi:creatininase family protein [Oceanobacillus sp. HCA-5259]|uniref:creatininase family protein n=1 Tax=Oceanobacillus sp. HCA-5259 TaxID=3134661 RepID=UPI0030BC1281